jgi:hypothetical protein
MMARSHDAPRRGPDIRLHPISGIVTIQWFSLIAGRSLAMLGGSLFWSVNITGGDRRVRWRLPQDHGR